MSENPYSKRKVNMMRVNALRSEGSIAKNLFIAYLSGVHTLDFDGEDAKRYPIDYYTFKKISEHTPSIVKLHDQINTYRAVKILKLLGTSVDNKKLSFLTAHKDPLGSMSAQDVLDVVQTDLNNYKLLLDAFICYRHRKAVRRLKFKIREELGMTSEEVKAYKIFMNIPNGLRPFVNTYKKQEKEKQLSNAKKP